MKNSIALIDKDVRCIAITGLDEHRYACDMFQQKGILVLSIIFVSAGNNKQQHCSSRCRYAVSQTQGLDDNMFVCFTVE